VEKAKKTNGKHRRQTRQKTRGGVWGFPGVETKGEGTDPTAIGIRKRGNDVIVGPTEGQAGKSVKRRYKKKESRPLIYNMGWF